IRLWREIRRAQRSEPAFGPELRSHWVGSAAFQHASVSATSAHEWADQFAAHVLRAMTHGAAAALEGEGRLDRLAVERLGGWPTILGKVSALPGTGVGVRVR